MDYLIFFENAFGDILLFICIALVPLNLPRLLFSSSSLLFGLTFLLSVCWEVPQLSLWPFLSLVRLVHFCGACPIFVLSRASAGGLLRPNRAVCNHLLSLFKRALEAMSSVRQGPIKESISHLTGRMLVGKALD